MAVVWGFMKFSADAQRCYDEIQTLGKEYTPEQIVDLARNPETELHKCFQWDDTIAAENWRRHQARKVCQSFEIVIEKRDRKAEPQRFRVIQHDHEERTYKPVIFMARKEDEYKKLLAQAKEEMRIFKNRYRSVVELESVIDAIEEALNG